MRPVNYFKSIHIVTLLQADDGFGNLIEVPHEAFWFNDIERLSVFDAIMNNDEYV